MNLPPLLWVSLEFQDFRIKFEPNCLSVDGRSCILARMKLTQFQTDLLETISNAGGDGLPARSLLRQQRRLLRQWLEGEQPLIRLMGLDATIDTLASHRIRLTEDGERALGLKPSPCVAISDHFAISQYQVAILHRMHGPELPRPMFGHDVSAAEMASLQGLCRAASRHRLVDWECNFTLRQCYQEDIEDHPHQCRYWLTEDGKRFVRGLMTVRLREKAFAIRRVAAKRPPTGAALEEIMAAIGGAPDNWDKC